MLPCMCKKKKLLEDELLVISVGPDYTVSYKVILSVSEKKKVSSHITDLETRRNALEHLTRICQVF